MIKPIDPGPKPPEDSKPIEPVKPTDKHAHGPSEGFHYKGMKKPMTWLHMHFTGKEAEKLWDSIIQQVTSQIRREQARALKALRKLGKSETSDDD